MGNLVFVLLTPLSHWSWFFAYVGSSVVRGLAVGLGVFIATLGFARPEFAARCGSRRSRSWGPRCWPRWA